MLTTKEYKKILKNIKKMSNEELEIAYDLVTEYENYMRLHDYETFLAYTSDGTWKTSKHLKYVIRKIEDVLSGKIKRLIINMGPRMGKSEITSKHLPSYILMNDPNKEIVTASYSGDLSASFNSIARDHFAEWAPILTSYTISKSKKATNHWGVEGFKGSATSCGIAGSLVGRGADILLIDDYCKSLNEALSDTIKESTWDWYQSVARTRLSPNGAIIVIATPWTYDDLCGRLISKMQDGSGEQWEIVKLPAFAEEDDPLNRRPGELLWPERFDMANMLETKTAVGSYIWQSQYQCSPTPNSGNIFKREWFQYYTELPNTNNMLISVDATFCDSKNSDYVVFQCWARDKANYYLVDQIRRQMDFVDTVDQLRIFCNKHPKARTKLIEKKANGDSIISVLKKEISGIIPITPHDSKVARAQSCAPYFESGNVYFPKNKNWAEDTIEEMIGFPYCKNDDTIDAMSQALNYWNKSSWRFS